MCSCFIAVTSPRQLYGVLLQWKPFLAVAGLTLVRAVSLPDSGHALAYNSCAAISGKKWVAPEDV